MGDDGHPTVIDAYWRAVRDRDPAPIADLVTEDFVEDGPQSGERIRGAEVWGQMVTGQPSYPAVALGRILGAGKVWVVEPASTTAATPACGGSASVLELSAERITRITQYFGAPFPAAEWRAGMTEPIGGAPA